MSPRRHFFFFSQLKQPPLPSFAMVSLFFAMCSNSHLSPGPHKHRLKAEMPEDECRSHTVSPQKLAPEAVSGRVGFVSSRFCSEMVSNLTGTFQTLDNDPCAALLFRLFCIFRSWKRRGTWRVSSTRPFAGSLLALYVRTCICRRAGKSLVRRAGSSCHFRRVC